MLTRQVSNIATNDSLATAIDTNSTITVKRNVASETKNEKTKNASKKYSTKPTSTKTYHTVKSGENLYRIALKYNTTVDKIKKDNNLKNDNIAVGRKLIIKD